MSMIRTPMLALVAICLLCGQPNELKAQADVRSLLDRMIKAQGGAERLSVIATSAAEGRIVLVDQGGITATVNDIHVYPDRAFTEYAFSDVDTISLGFDGEVAWQNYPRVSGLEILPEATKKQMARDAIGFGVLLEPETYGVEYAYRGRQTADGEEYHVLEQIFSDGTRVTLYVDTASFLIHKKVSYEGSGESPSILEEYHSDYRDVDGITLAHRIALYRDGQESSVISWDRFVYNVEVDTTVFHPTEEQFNRADLIADVRELSDIIESTHPDPYRLIGGKIEYHRRFQQVLHAIPAGGMSKSDFRALLRPFIAAIGDAHTNVYAEHAVDERTPGGAPLRFKAVASSLVVSGVPAATSDELLGATLVAVEGVSFEELEARLVRLRPVENTSHLLWFLSTRYLGSRDYLKELLPEWTTTDKIRIALRLLGGSQVEHVFTLPVDVSKLVGVESQIALPEPDESGIAFDIIGDENEIGFLRIDHMKHYRERSELRASFGMETLSEEDLRAIPSATEFFRSAAVAMKEADCEALIVDLRENDGGEATMADILMYFLYGKATTQRTRTNTITKVSKAYLDAREHVTLDALNRNRDVALVEGDYDFSDDHTSGVLSRDSSMDEAFAQSPTFFGEWSSGAYESYYRPDRVMVLVGPQTFSAGFLLALRMYLAGAELVGAPPSSAPNSAGNMTGWSLTNSGITGWVSQSYALNFPDEAGIGRELPVHHALTLELLSHFDYDPNAEVLYALELLNSTGSQDR